MSTTRTTSRIATCSCGQLRATCEGEPVRVSVCHCLACQKRTGSAFGAQARWPKDAVRVEGNASQWTRRAESGNAITFRFCGVCGSTVFYELDALPGFTAVALGAFADPSFPPPSFSVYENRKHAWVTLPDGIDRD
ncbi:MAG: GFA family protein [Labilithrix sp.]|nr:GFA family protein [Labilithrix sp.]MCW5815827.1 GFA family protein [Labilithrix sp.]